MCLLDFRSSHSLEIDSHSLEVDSPCCQSQRKGSAARSTCDSYSLPSPIHAAYALASSFPLASNHPNRKPKRQLTTDGMFGLGCECRVDTSSSKVGPFHDGCIWFNLMKGVVVKLKAVEFRNGLACWAVRNGLACMFWGMLTSAKANRFFRRMRALFIAP